MLRQAIPDQIAREIAHQLSAGFPARILKLGEMKRAVIPKSFTPDRVFQVGDEIIFVHSLASGAIPAWVRAAKKRTQAQKHSRVLLLASNTKDSTGTRIAAAVAKDAVKLGFGLAMMTGDGVFLIFPPSFKQLKPPKSKSEAGHIPSWIYQRIANAENISETLREVLEKFSVKYQRATSGSEISYNKECRLLSELAESIAENDPRLFFPLERLHALRAFERGGANPLARDHFFHTFNNFFLGLLVLDGLLSNRDNTASPDMLIADGRKRSKLRLWESLWFLTAMFHDPGYIPENFWSLFSFAYGFEHDPTVDRAIPVEVVQGIRDAWNTEFVRARAKLVSTYAVVNRSAVAAKAARDFESAAKVAYFNGKTTGHSLISGLTLLHLCASDGAASHTHYNKEIALNACGVAALSMLFHDQHCRDTLARNKVRPISFEDLPYASTLMFVDALQDDRRDRTRSKFPKRGILESLQIEGARGLVFAKVCLSALEVDQWPKRIAEYENLMAWVNGGSRTKFIIDYRN